MDIPHQRPLEVNISISTPTTISYEPTITIPGHGSLRGLKLDTGGLRFLNVPYALPPVGPRRWKKPVTLPADYHYSSSGEPRDCTRYGELCHQPDYIIGGKNLSYIEGAVHGENCLLLNIWMPEDALTSDVKLPVYVWIHGGWLQMGNPCYTDNTDPKELLSKEGAGLTAIIVAVGYRLNIFGFLSGEACDGNFGFWDQRCALEWVQQNISYFGGDPKRVTLGGLSAGSYSTHAQLQFELLHARDSEPLFQNVFMCSNAIPVQPKPLSEGNEQLQNVCRVFGLPSDLAPEEKLERLREVPARDLIDRMKEFRLHTFRASTDNDFIHHDMMTNFRDGTVAQAFKQRDMRILIGEAENEQALYALTNPPASIADLPTALENYYPSSLCAKLMNAYKGAAASEPGELYGIITSDLQVRAPMRSWLSTLSTAGVPLSSVFRYRSNFRAKCIDGIYRPTWGVTHGLDMCTWWYIARFGFDEREKETSRAWLNRSLVSLIEGRKLDSGCERITQYLEFCEDGSMKVVEDGYWERLMELNALLAEE